MTFIVLYCCLAAHARFPIGSPYRALDRTSTALVRLTGVRFLQSSVGKTVRWNRTCAPFGNLFGNLTVFRPDAPAVHSDRSLGFFAVWLEQCVCGVTFRCIELQPSSSMRAPDASNQIYSMKAKNIIYIMELGWQFQSCQTSQQPGKVSFGASNSIPLYKVRKTFTHLAFLKR